MSDVKLPEVGSRWVVNGREVVVTNTAKRGRGYQVFIDILETGDTQRLRLKDFWKGVGI